MSSISARHPFTVGEQYRNELGQYTVLGIDPPDIVIQYRNGQTITSSIELQMRIWERIKDEEEMSAPKPVRKSTTKRSGGKSRTGYGKKFHGLQESDFALELSGTSGRRREELGGLLALDTSEKTEEIFESMAVPRRSQIHIVFPNHYPGKEKNHVAKYLFDVSPDGAFYGFYIEKNSGPMDNSWDWPRFVRALKEDSALQARTQVAMAELGLRWEINVELPEAPLNRYVVEEDGSLYLIAEGEDDREEIDWNGFAQLLEAIPDDAYCNLTLATRINQERAIELGVGIANEAANVYQALMPLYEAAV